MKVLVLNCGSSSVKYQLMEMGDTYTLLAKGLVERIGLEEGEIIQKADGKETYTLKKQIEDHVEGISLIVNALLDSKCGVIKNINEINAVGHRVVHGGEDFTQSVIITDEVKAIVEKCVDLAPLHNPANLKGIEAMEKVLPGVPQVGVFDTSFHQTMPPKAFLYGLPYEFYTKDKVRRYGFHGTSHKYVSAKACELLNIDIKKQRIITCHLGNGSSIAAVKYGKSVDTSMGFTPVEGLIMGTRSGDIDAGILFYLSYKDRLDYRKINNILNKESGMKGLSGVSSDMRDVYEALDKGNERAEIALDVFAYRVKKYIGSYAFAMGGVDMIVFTGGIGENDTRTRERICKDLEDVGVDFDYEINSKRIANSVLTKPGSKIKVMTVATNEELVIAMDTMKLLTSKEVHQPA